MIVPTLDDDLTFLADTLDGETPVLHCNPDSDGGGHITKGLLDTLCPCEPEVTMEQDVIVIYHRRTQ